METTHLLLATWLRMSGAVPALHLYAFMAPTETTVPLPCRETDAPFIAVSNQGTLFSY